MPPQVNSSALVIRGARTHNLKNVDLTLPAGQLIVFTGVSGSGKSSLAFDTIYAEGQRRYVESLSAYARQFLERMEKPDVDRIDGICPSIAIRQKNSRPQSALDGRHGHRDPRLHAPALRARGPHHLPPVRTGSDSRNRGSGGQPAARAARGHAPDARLRPADASPRRKSAAARRVRKTTSVRKNRCSRSSRRAVGGAREPAPQGVRPPADGRSGGGVRGRRSRHAQGDDAAARRRRPHQGGARCAHAHHRFRGDRRMPKAAAPRGPSAAALRRRRRAGRRRRQHSSPSGSSAAPAASPTRIRSRGCSRSTTRSARARPATASATSSSSIRSWWSPTRRSRSTRARSSRGPSRTIARSWPS